MKKTNLIISILLLCFFLNACSNSTPSDEVLEQEIIEHASKCQWKIFALKGKIYERYGGNKIDIYDISITDKFFSDNSGSVKFKFKAEKIGKADDAWYVLEQNTIHATDYFTYSGEWELKKYDSGWKISEKPIMYGANFLKSK